MILPESRSIEWLHQVATENNFPNITMLEKTIRAFSLLESLALSGCPFVFKGGTALMLHLNSAKRLSIDVDIICPPETNIEQYLHQYVEKYGFNDIKLIERKTAHNIPKSHAKFYYQVIYNTNTDTDCILLDVLFDKIHYNNVVKLPIESHFLKTDSEKVFVNVPSIADLLGDKLTAFAPNTTGIPYYKGNKMCSMEIVKQLYDIASLIDITNDLTVTSKTFRKMAAVELAYRNLNPDDIQQVLDDIFQTSLCVCLQGQVDNEHFNLLQDGIKRIQSYIHSERYILDTGIINASKVAYLVTLISNNVIRYEHFNKDKIMELQDKTIEHPLPTKLNKLKKSNIEAFYYWWKVFEIEKNKEKQSSFLAEINTMKIIHTADWHLGQTFYEYERKKEHLLFLKWLQEQVKTLSVNVLLISGDIFDSQNPSADSQKILYRFLREITTENPHLQIVIIAGNHDSAARLEAPNPLLEEMNITVRGIVRRTEDGEIDCEHLTVPLYQEGKPAAWCLAVPYLRQGDYPPAESYAQGIEKMYALLYEKLKDRPEPIIAMGHLQTTGAEISIDDRSERVIIGGLECVSSDVFSKNFAYTALGHLHRSQRVAKSEHVRYSGSPLPMSFAEKNNKQSVTLITIENQYVTIKLLPFEPPVKLLSIPEEARPLAEVLQAIDALPAGDISDTSPYLEVKIHISEPEPALRHQVENALKNKSVRLARLVAQSSKTEQQTTFKTFEDFQKISPMEVAGDIFKRRFGEEMPENMKNLLHTVIQEVAS